jgi:hypothetical protein
MDRKTLQPHLDSARRITYSLCVAFAVSLIAIMIFAVGFFAAKETAPIFALVSRTTFTLGGVALILVAIVLAYLSNCAETRFRVKLENMYIGTRWISPDGQTGTVQSVSEFGDMLDLAFPDGRSAVHDIQVLRPAGHNPELLPDSQLASIPSQTALELLGTKDSAHFNMAIVLGLLIVGAFVGAIALIPGQGDGEGLLRLFCVMVPLVSLLVICVRGLGIKELQTQTMIRKFSDSDWIAPDGRVGKFGSFSREANEVTLVMEDRSLRQFKPDELVQA